MRRLMNRTLDYIQDCLRDVVNEQPQPGNPVRMNEEEAPRWWAWGCMALIVGVSGLVLATTIAQVAHWMAR